MDRTEIIKVIEVLTKMLECEDANSCICDCSKCNLYTRAVDRSNALIMAIEALEQSKAYTKADYIMALHKEYGCTLTRAEEAHDKALEYLRNKAIIKG